MNILHRKRWAEGWLRGIARAAMSGRVPKTTVISAIARVRSAGLTDHEIHHVLSTAPQLRELIPFEDRSA